MSRFANLEFGSEPGDLGRRQSADQDERGFLVDARSAFENGRFEAALRLYAKVLESNAENTTAWAGQVRMLIELGELREARLWADKALERFPRDAELLAAKAVALARLGSLEEALACSDASLEERGDAPYLWLARGDVMLARREQRADYCFDKALLLAPGDWFVAWLAARIRCFYNQAAQGLRLLQQALEWNAAHFLLWLELGRCQHQLGLVGPARHSLAQARELNPRCDEIAPMLAQLARTGFWSRLRGWWLSAFRK